MAEIEEKLKNFEAICISEAKKQKKELEEKIKERTQNIIQNEIGNFKKKQENKKNKILLKLEKEYNTNLWNLENEYQQKDVELNKNIENKLFEELKTQFIEITQSEKYESYFKKNVYETINKISQKDNLIIFVTKNDKIRFTNFLCNLNYKIETIDDSNIGGCIVQNIEESINNTILENLKEKINEYKGNI